MKQLRTPQFWMVLALLCFGPMLRLMAGGGFVPVTINEDPIDWNQRTNFDSIIHLQTNNPQLRNLWNNPDKGLSQAAYQVVSPINDPDFITLEPVSDINYIPDGTPPAYLNDQTVFYNYIADNVYYPTGNLGGYVFTGEIIEGTTSFPRKQGYLYVDMYTNVPRYKVYKAVLNDDSLNLVGNDAFDNVLIVPNEIQADNTAAFISNQVQVDNVPSVVLDQIILDNVINDELQQDIVSLDEEDIEAYPSETPEEITLSFEPSVTNAILYNPPADFDLSTLQLELADNVLNEEAEQEAAAHNDVTEKQGLSNETTATLAAWPNPTSGKFQTLLKGVEEGTITYTIVSLNGQIIQTLETEAQEVHFDLSGHSAGIYYLQATQGSTTWSVEILLQR